MPSLYSFLIMALICSNSTYVFWILMEVNTVLFLVYVGLINFNHPFRLSSDTINQLFYYFILQSCVSILILMSLNLRKNSSFFLESSTFFDICFLFKIGLFPFYFWVIKIIKYLDWFGTFLLLGPQKIYFLFFIFFNLSKFWYLVLWINLFLGPTIIISSFRIRELLLGSSIRRTIILFFLFNSSVIIFVLFIIVYLFCVFLLLKNSHFDSIFSSILFFSVSLVFLSSPFFPFFLLKFQMFIFAYKMLDLFEFFWFWLGLFACFMGYLCFFFFNFTWRYKFYNFNAHVNYMYIFLFFIFFVAF